MFPCNMLFVILIKTGFKFVKEKTNIQEYIFLRLVDFYFRTWWGLLITLIIQRTLRQISCSTQMIRNYDVISYKIAHRASKTAL